MTAILSKESKKFLYNLIEKGIDGKAIDSIILPPHQKEELDALELLAYDQQRVYPNKKAITLLTHGKKKHFFVTKPQKDHVVVEHLNEFSTPSWIVAHTDTFQVVGELERYLIYQSDNKEFLSKKE